MTYASTTPTISLPCPECYGSWRVGHIVAYAGDFLPCLCGGRGPFLYAHGETWQGWTLDLSSHSYGATSPDGLFICKPWSEPTRRLARDIFEIRFASGEAYNRHAAWLRGQRARMPHFPPTYPPDFASPEAPVR